MATVPDAIPDVHSTPDPLVLNWEMLSLSPPELIDPLADDDMPAPIIPSVPFAQWLEDQASYFRSLGHSGADFIAELIQSAAETARALQASSPSEYEARFEVLDGHDEWQEAYSAGYSACQRDYYLPRF